MIRPEAKETPLISVVLPAYNEEALLRNNVEEISKYLDSLKQKYDWELLIINDGSNDQTGVIADRLADANQRIRALHHPTNFGLGQVLKFGFANSHGDYIVTLDVDLSYDVRHIEELVDKIQHSHAKIVVASPYMTGGEIRNVPGIRRFLSIAGNKFLSFFVRGHLSTLTSMVRVYDGPFIRALDLRAMGMDVMPEVLYKAFVLRARIDEIPGRLDWGPQLEYGQSRSSSMRLARHVVSTILSGFIFRPFLFFVFPGLAIGAFSLYVNFWMFVHFFDAVSSLSTGGAEYSFSKAFALAYAEYPHTFVTGLLSAMLAIQLIGLGVIALQNKRYFEELFHLGSSSLSDIRRPVK